MFLGINCCINQCKWHMNKPHRKKLQNIEVNKTVSFACSVLRFGLSVDQCVYVRDIVWVCVCVWAVAVNASVCALVVRSGSVPTSGTTLTPVTLTQTWWRITSRCSTASGLVSVLSCGKVSLSAPQRLLLEHSCYWSHLQQCNNCKRHEKPNYW